MQGKDYSIGDAARLTGITEKQLRNWEQRGYIKGVSRVVSGERSYRRYSEDLIHQIESIKALLEEGFTLPAAAAKASAGAIPPGPTTGPGPKHPSKPQ